VSSAPKKSPRDSDPSAVGSPLRGGPSATLPLNRYIAYFAIAITGCALDLGTKEAVFRWRGLPRPNNAWWLIDGRFGIETSVNPGALFGMGAGWWWLFASLSVVALIGIFVWLFILKAAHDRWLTVALAFVTGGILGNLYDRLGFWNSRGLGPELAHGVRDWILFVWPESGMRIFNPWPNFNIADSLLVTGAIMLIVHAIAWRDVGQQAAETSALKRTAA
jgi:signal peptidase II